MKKIFALALTLCLVVALSGCSMLTSLIGNLTGGDTSSSVAGGGAAVDSGAAANNDGAYAIGDKISTAFFTFTVKSAAFVDEYAGATAGEGRRLVDVVIATTNTFGDDIPMFDTDYIILWGDGENDWNYCLDPLDATMAESEYTLTDGETMERHYIFEVAADATGLEICYTEFYDDDSTGDSYFVAIGL